MAVDVFQVLVDDDVLRRKHTMEPCVFGCVERNEHIGHNAAASIHRAMVAKGVELQRVGKVDAVRIGQFAMFQTLVKVHAVILRLTFLIRLLYATACRSVVVGHRQANHRAVG